MEYNVKRNDETKEIEGNKQFMGCFLQLIF